MFGRKRGRTDSRESNGASNPKDCSGDSDSDDSADAVGASGYGHVNSPSFEPEIIGRQTTMTFQGRRIARFGSEPDSFREQRRVRCSD